MKAVLKNGYGSNYAGDEVDVIVSPDGNQAFFFDSGSVGWYINKIDYELKNENAGDLLAGEGLIGNLASMSSSFHIEFKK